MKRKVFLHVKLMKETIITITIILLAISLIFMNKKQQEQRKQEQDKKYKEMIKEIEYKDRGEIFRKNEYYQKIVMPQL